MQAHCLTRETFRSFFEETCQAHGAHCTSSICAINVTSGYVSRLNAECPLCLEVLNSPIDLVTCGAIVCSNCCCT